LTKTQCLKVRDYIRYLDMKEVRSSKQEQFKSRYLRRIQTRPQFGVVSRLERGKAIEGIRVEGLPIRR
jgi:hypothetical protein